LEQAGAVFLPAAGYRKGIWVIGGGSIGFYWLASYGSSNLAWYVGFGDSYLGMGNISGRCYGYSVRLARVAEN
jgi:hypothetical protein